MYLPGKLIVIPVEKRMVHLCIYSCPFFIVKLIYQFSNVAHFTTIALETIDKQFAIECSSTLRS